MLNSTDFNFPKHISFNHIRRLTKEIGIIQHAKYAIPDYRHGYCLDDNARALQLLSQYRYMSNDSSYDDLIDIYLAYVTYAQNEDGSFKNFMSIEHQFLDTCGSEDAFGRAIMALGAVLKYDNRLYVQKTVHELLDRSYEKLKSFQSIRAAAYTICGLYAAHQSQVYRKNVLPELINLAQFLYHEYNAAASESWRWYEKIITYDNAIIPYALFLASELTQDEEWRQIALQSTLFIDKIIFRNEYPVLIGNENWFAHGRDVCEVGQQAIEIPALILLYKKVKEIEPTAVLKGSAKNAYAWFFGNNNIKKSLYDPETKGCYDGIDCEQINYNQGAESVISLWQSYMYMNYGCL